MPAGTFTRALLGKAPLQKSWSNQVLVSGGIYDEDEFAATNVINYNRPSDQKGTMPSAKKSASSPKQSAPSKNEVLYDQLIATIPALERKGDANPYTSLNGNMFTLLHQSRLAIRLPGGEREKFLKKYKTKLFEAYGAVMQEYVAVPDTLLENTKELQKYLALSYQYAKTLKPKPTKKKR
jgi:TfoX/Sxy family transcriptional regulator of competence genes